MYINYNRRDFDKIKKIDLNKYNTIFSILQKNDFRFS